MKRTFDEVLNDYRVIPRALIICWCLLVYSAYSWYTAYDIQYETKCDAKVLELLIQAKHEKPESIACTVTDVVGRPAGYTALLSVLFGAATGIFGLYVNSGGRKKDEGD